MIIRVYTSIVAVVIVSDIFLTGSVNPILKNPFNILKNILNNVFYDGYGNDNILKCLVNLGVNGLRPPPGGALQHNNVTFSMNF